MIYLHYYETESGFTEERNNNYEEPWTSYIEETDKVNYNMTEDEKLLTMPLTVEALGNGSISWALGNRTLQYSKNKGDWSTMGSGTSISVSEGDEVCFKGTNVYYCGCTLTCTAQFNLKGNFLSIVYGDNFSNENAIPDNNYFAQNIFSGNTTLIDASELKLAATVLRNYCYYNMFNGCTNLTKAPELSATTIISSCYSSMFKGCTSLTEAPKLPAKTLDYACYNSMFYGCTSLTKAPELPATTTARACYQNMFYGCTSLTKAPELPATSTTQDCYNSMFRGCTSLVKAPELNALNVAEASYQRMFYGCTNLNYVKAMFTTYFGPSSSGWARSIEYWLSGVSATGTFVKNTNATWTDTGASGVPNGWTIEYETPSE